MIFAIAAHAEVIKMPVPVRTLAAGAALNEDDFSLKNFEVNDIVKNNYAIAMVQLANREPIRPLPVGKPVALSLLRQVVEIHKGELVASIYRRNGLTIESKLIALQDGSIGEVITARSPESGRTIFGLVAAGRVFEVTE